MDNALALFVTGACFALFMLVCRHFIYAFASWIRETLMGGSRL